MKRFLCFLLLPALLLGLMGCGNQVTIDYGTSTIYTKADMDFPLHQRLFFYMLQNLYSVTILPFVFFICNDMILINHHFCHFIRQKVRIINFNMVLKLYLSIFCIELMSFCISKQIPFTPFYIPLGCLSLHSMWRQVAFQTGF